MARLRNFETGSDTGRTKIFLSGDLDNGIGATAMLRPANFNHYDYLDHDVTPEGTTGNDWANYSARRDDKDSDENYQIPLFNYTPPTVDSLWSHGGDQLSVQHVLSMAAHRSLRNSGSMPTHSPDLSTYSAPLVARAIDRGHLLPHPDKRNRSAHYQARIYSSLPTSEIESNKDYAMDKGRRHYEEEEYDVISNLDPTKNLPISEAPVLESSPGTYTGSTITEHSEDAVKQMNQEVRAHINKTAEKNKPEYKGKHIRTHNPDQLSLF